MKYLTLACLCTATLTAGYATAQTAIYDTITGSELSKTYVYSGDAYLFGDLISPKFSRPVSKIEVVYHSTLVRGGRFTVSATLWSGSFQTFIDSVEGFFVVPPLANPNVPETWLLTISPVNIPLNAFASHHGISFITSPVVDNPGIGEFVPLFGLNPTRVGNDYTGFAIDTNLNGILEPQLPIPYAEWFNPWPTAAHANLFCALYQMTQFGPARQANSTPQVSARRINLGDYQLRMLGQAADPLKDLR